MSKHNCLRCGGKGEVTVSEPECDYAAACCCCGGTWLKQIAALKSKAAEIEKTVGSNAFWELGTGDHQNMIYILLEHIESLGGGRNEI